jgi:hypothetical protein
MLYHVRGVDGLEGGVREAGQIPRIAYMVHGRTWIDIEDFPSLCSNDTADVQFSHNALGQNGSLNLYRFGVSLYRGRVLNSRLPRDL